MREATYLVGPIPVLVAFWPVLFNVDPASEVGADELLPEMHELALDLRAAELDLTELKGCLDLFDDGADKAYT